MNETLNDEMQIRRIVGQFGVTLVTGLVLQRFGTPKA